MDVHDPVSDDDLERLWADASGELTVDEIRQLRLDLTTRPALRAAHERIVAAQRQLATLDAGGDVPDIATPVITRLAARQSAPAKVALAPWLWLAPVAQVLLALVALAWALPGLWPLWYAQVPAAFAPWLAIGDGVVQAQALGAEWLAALGALNRATWVLAADGSAAGLWLGVCVAGATLTWLAGNSVLLATRSLRR